MSTTPAAVVAARSGARVHHLDALRTLMVAEVVIGHAAMSFARKAPPGWAALDVARSAACDLLIFVIASHAMQCFFLLAGFFTLMVIRQRGVTAFAVNRWQRIGLPLLLSLVTILPLLLVVGLYGTHQRRPDAIGTPFWPEVAAYFTTGIRSTPLNFGHLWFLEYLLLVTALFIGARQVVRRVPGLGASLDRAVQAAMASPLRPLLFAVPTAVLMHWMDWMIDTPSRAMPEWHIVAYYLFFFSVGALFARAPEAFTAPQRHWKAYLAVGWLVAMPLTFLLVMRASGTADMRAAPAYTAAQACCAVLTWCSIFGLLGWFQARASAPSPRARYLSEAAMWVYIVHFPVVLYLQVLVMTWSIPALVKFALVCTVSWAVLLGSYELLARRTWIGALLNGKPRALAGS